MTTSQIVRFTAGREGTLAYFAALAEIFTRRGVPKAAAFEAVVARMHALAGETVRRPLGSASPVPA